MEVKISEVPNIGTIINVDIEDLKKVNDPKALITHAFAD